MPLSWGLHPNIDLCPAETGIRTLMCAVGSALSNVLDPYAVRPIRQRVCYFELTIGTNAEVAPGRVPDRSDSYDSLGDASCDSFLSISRAELAPNAVKMELSGSDRDVELERD